MDNFTTLRDVKYVLHYKELTFFPLLQQTDSQTICQAVELRRSGHERLYLWSMVQMTCENELFYNMCLEHVIRVPIIGTLLVHLAPAYLARAA